MHEQSQFRHEVIRNFLNTLFCGCDGYAFVLGHKPPAKENGFRNHRVTDFDDLESVVASIHETNEQQLTCSYISANLFRKRGKGRKVDDVAALRALVVDIDFVSDDPGVRKRDVKDKCVPEGEEHLIDYVLGNLHEQGNISFVVDTGHGRQVWLLFGKPFPLESREDRSLATKISKAFSDFIWLKLREYEVYSGVDGRPNIERVWRIPGTVNRKGSVAVSVSMFLPDNNARFDKRKVMVLLADQLENLDRKTVCDRLRVTEEELPCASEVIEKLNSVLDRDEGLKALWEGNTESAKRLIPAMKDSTGSGCLFHFARVLYRKFCWSEGDARAAVIAAAKKNGWGHHKSRVDSIFAELNKVDPGKLKGKKRAQADILKGLALRHFHIMWAGNSEAFASPIIGDQRALSIRSDEFRGQLHEIFEEEQGMLPTATAVNAILPSLVFAAKKRGRERIWRRVAMPNQCTVVVDLYQHDHPGRCVVITPEGWEVQETWPDGVMFDTSATMAALPTPKRGRGSLDGIREALGMAGCHREEDWRLLVGFMVSTLLPLNVHPILICEGKPASGKSFALGQIRRLVDPHGVDDDDDGSSIPSKSESLAGWVRNEYFIVFDNVGHVTREISEQLCLTVKGSYKIKTRTLYTTAEVTTIFGPVFVGMSMIGSTTTPPDLLSRVLRIRFSRPRGGWELPPDQAIDLVTNSMPGALADLYDLCASVLRESSISRPKLKHRLYDFLWILTSLDFSQGWQTARAFLQASSLVQEEAVSDLPFTEVITKALSGRESEEFEGTLREFLSYLKSCEPHVLTLMADSGVLDGRGSNRYVCWEDESVAYQALAGKLASWLQSHSRALEAVGIYYERIGGRPARWRFWLERDEHDLEAV